MKNIDPCSGEREKKNKKNKKRRIEEADCKRSWGSLHTTKRRGKAGDRQKKKKLKIKKLNKLTCALHGTLDGHRDGGNVPLHERCGPLLRCSDPRRKKKSVDLSVRLCGGDGSQALRESGRRRRIPSRLPGMTMGRC